VEKRPRITFYELKFTQDMHSITFHCETITPMFLSGADGQTPELRAPSIKGALRFWWRALNGHLPERDGNRWDYSKLQKEEANLFGGTGSNTKRSSFALQVIPHENLRIKRKAEPVPHKPFMKQDAIDIKQSFDVVIRFRNSDAKEKLKSIFVLTALLGGLGKRVRRGMGSFTIHNVEVDGEKDATFKMPENAKDIYMHLNKVSSNNFLLKTSSLIESKFGKTPDYPYIKKIEIGRSDSRLLRKISETTHEVKEQNKWTYDVSMGGVRGGRFASPIYVSVLSGNIPIITTLNTVPKRDKHKVSTNIQDDFKNKIL
jgi:CRISPR-associated protein Cmr1